MSETFLQLLEKASETGEGRIKASHLASQFQVLEKMYEDEGTRDAAYLLATDWVENGTPLRKAAAAAWAKEKRIPVGDQEDPSAQQPTPNDLSNGIDAPDSGPRAAGAGEAANDAKPETKHAPNPTDGKKVKKDLISRLRAMKGQRIAPAAHAGSDAAAAAYEAGVRDATRRHANTTHRVAAMTARHTFALGTDAGRRMGEAVAAHKVSNALSVNQQANVTSPDMGMGKADLATRLAKAYDTTKHPREHDGKFSSKTWETRGRVAGALALGAAGYALTPHFSRGMARGIRAGSNALFRRGMIQHGAHTIAHGVATEYEANPNAGASRFASTSLGVTVGNHAGGAAGRMVDEHGRKKRAMAAAKAKQLKAAIAAPSVGA
jgi:hypothetical protein